MRDEANGAEYVTSQKDMCVEGKKNIALGNWRWLNNLYCLLQEDQEVVQKACEILQ